MTFASTVFSRVPHPDLDLPFSAENARRFFQDRLPQLPDGLASDDLRARLEWLQAAAKVLSDVDSEDVRKFPDQFEPTRVGAMLLSKATGVKFPRNVRIPWALRRSILIEQGWQCHYGRGQLKRNRFAPGLWWQIDHKWPKSRGGSDNRVNLVASCVKHNMLKGTRPYTLYRIDLARDRELRRCGF